MIFYIKVLDVFAKCITILIMKYHHFKLKIMEHIIEILTDLLNCNNKSLKKEILWGI